MVRILQFFCTTYINWQHSSVQFYPQSFEVGIFRKKFHTSVVVVFYQQQASMQSNQIIGNVHLSKLSTIFWDFFYKKCCALVYYYFFYTIFCYQQCAFVEFHQISGNDLLPSFINNSLGIFYEFCKARIYKKDTSSNYFLVFTNLVFNYLRIKSINN